MAIKYLGDESVGQPFETGETRTVAVTTEALDLSAGYEGDVITYTATIKDSTVAVMPATFGVQLKINGIELASVVLDATVYDQVSGLFTLPWTVPALVGSYTVKLSWVDQTI